MESQINKLIDYIENNLLYGSQIFFSDLKALIDRYNIKLDDYDILVEEIKSLKIIVIIQGELFSKNFFLEISKVIINKEILQSNLNNFFLTHSIQSNEQNNIYLFLLIENITIKKDIENSKNLTDSNENFFEWFDDYDNDLDLIINSDSFNNELLKLEDPIDRKYNLDYISEFQNKTLKYEKSIENLIKANSRLVMKVAVRYWKTSKRRVDLDDLIQEGNIGLIIAAKKFDLSTGNQFSTYAISWISQRISRYINNNANLIRIPIHMIEKMNKFDKNINQLERDLQRKPTSHDIIARFKYSQDEIDFIERTKNLINSTSTDIVINEDTTISTFIEDKIGLSQFDAVFIKEREENIKALLKEKLNPKELKVINERFGFSDGKIHTLEEIGKELNLTRERVRQIEEKVLRKLSRESILVELGDYYD